MNDVTEPEVEETVAATTEPEAEIKETSEPDLNDLLNEFDTNSTRQETEEPETVTYNDPLEKSKVDTVFNYIEEQQRREAEQSTRQGIDSAVEAIKQVDGVTLPDHLIESHLQQQAAKDRRLLRAWQQREVNPDAWNKVLKGVGRSLAKDLKLPDPKLTEDMNSLRASTKTSTKPSEPDSMEDIVNDEAKWQAYKQANGMV